jgi:hypothetical protein
MVRHRFTHRAVATIRVAVLVFVASSLAGVSGPAAAGGGRNANSYFFPAGSHPFGKSYAEWSAAFSKWGLEYPLDGHPFANPDFDFANRQSGKVWFYGAEGTVERDLTLPAGTALLLPLRDAECSSIEEPPFFGATEQEQRDCAAFFADHIVDVFAEVDGVPVENLADYRFSSPQYEFDAPTPNIVALSAATARRWRTATT